MCVFVCVCVCVCVSKKMPSVLFCVGAVLTCRSSAFSGPNRSVKPRAHTHTHTSLSLSLSALQLSLTTENPGYQKRKKKFSVLGGRLMSLLTFGGRIRNKQQVRCAHQVAVEV